MLRVQIDETRYRGAHRDNIAATLGMQDTREHAGALQSRKTLTVCTIRRGEVAVLAYESKQKQTARKTMHHTSAVLMWFAKTEENPYGGTMGTHIVNNIARTENKHDKQVNKHPS